MAAVATLIASIGVEMEPDALLNQGLEGKKCAAGKKAPPCK